MLAPVVAGVGFMAVLCIAPALVGAPADTSSLQSVVRAVAGEVRPDEAVGFMRTVYSTDRWFTFPKFYETARYLRKTMAEIGLEKNELVEVPADGVSQYGFWTEPLAWDVKSATLRIVEPRVPDAESDLADYGKIPASLGMWSGPTPPGGITAEVVELPSQKPEDILRLDLRGKLVMVSNPPEIKWALAKAGALGAINTFTENPSLKDGRQWMNAWGDNGWGFTKGSAPLLSFSISPRQTALLRKLLARGPVRVHADVQSRYYPGVYPYVTGIIPGTGDEDVLVLAHTSEQGAQDNATGVSAMLEAMSTIARLISSGKLPRPQRSLRMIGMGEMYGSMHYVANNPERVRRTVAAICLDTPAASYDIAGTEYTFYMVPQSAPSYVDAFILKIAETYLPTVKRPWHERPFMTGTDTYLSEPLVGIPTAWPYSGSGVETHHNSEDTPDRVDPRSLRDVTIMTAAYLYYIATAGQSEAEWLGEVALSRGYEQTVKAASPYFDRIAGSANADELAAALRDGIAKIRYTAERQSIAVRSASRLAPAAKPDLERLARRLDPFAAEQIERLRDAANARAVSLNLKTPVAPAPDAADPQLERGASMIVKRKRFGTIPLDDLAVDKREGFPSGAWATVPITALYWCDRRRTLADVIRRTRLELGHTDFDFVGYFQFLARHNYVEIVNARE